MNKIRVRKADVKPTAWIKPDQVDYCIDCWKTWIAGDPDKDLGVKTMSMLRGLQDGYGSSADEQQQARDNRIGAATDAMIDSLGIFHRWAVYKVCGIGQVWSFPHADLAATYAAARAELEQKLRRNVCTAVLF